MFLCNSYGFWLKVNKSGEARRIILMISEWSTRGSKTLNSKLKKSSPGFARGWQTWRTRGGAWWRGRGEGRWTRWWGGASPPPPAPPGSRCRASAGPAATTAPAWGQPGGGQSGDLSLVQIHWDTVLWLVGIMTLLTLLCHKDTAHCYGHLFSSTVSLWQKGGFNARKESTKGAIL